MRNADTETHQPNTQSGVVAAASRTPGRTIVTGDPLGQAITAKDLDNCCLGSDLVASGAGLERNGKARMVIQNGQRITTTLRQFEFAFEIHLPKLIRLRSFETA